jgi:hypothetical protein
MDPDRTIYVLGVIAHVSQWKRTRVGNGSKIVTRNDSANQRSVIERHVEDD